METVDTMDTMDTMYIKLLLIKNIHLGIPKDISESIKAFLFYDIVTSIRRYFKREVTDTISNRDIFRRINYYNAWHYDRYLQIFMNSSVSVIIYSECPDLPTYDVDMCATLCDYCGNYMESDTVEKEDMPLCIQCTC
jgi:hypothetical protein